MVGRGAEAIALASSMKNGNPIGYPVSEKHFIEECAKYFTNIYFHSKVETSLATVEPSFFSVSMEIIRNLSALNDEFRKYYIPNNRPRTLIEFSSGTGLEASPEGNAARKNDFTFEFEYKVGEDIKKERICCEPHLKLSNADGAGNTHYYFNRIYFHEGKEYLYGGKILVGHIGRHL